MIDVDVNPLINQIDLNIETDDLSCDLVIEINAVDIDINVSPGLLGLPGPQGPQGPQGEAGQDGTDGTDGIDGINGTNGLDGEDGADGIDGESAYQIALDNGFIGTESEWLESIKGEQGDTGIPGQNGSNGLDGNDGDQGPKGDTGDTGSQGTQGPQGEKGDTGENGTDGVDGQDGSQGIQGEQGIQGIQGEDGIDGTNGTDGAQGIQGPEGPTSVSTDADNTAILGNDGLIYVPPGIPDSGSANLRYIFSSATNPQEPTPNTLQINNADPNLATEIYFSTTAYPNRSVSNILELLKDNDALYLQQSSDDDIFINANIVGEAVNNGSFFTVPIEIVTAGIPFTPNSFTDLIVYHSGSGNGTGGGLSEDEVVAIAAGSTLGLDQSLLANAGQPGLTVLAVGYTDTGKVQGTSLGDGNVVEVYVNGEDFNAGTVLYREFMSLGEPICFTGLPFGAIIRASQGFYGFSEQINGNDESPMPLLSYGLSFTSTFFFAFRNSSSLPPANSNQGWVHVVAGPLKTLVTLKRGTGVVVDGQENIEVQPWGYLRLFTDGDTEFILEGTNPIMACVAARMDNDGSGRYSDSRLIMPLTNDGITWPRSGNVSAPFDNTLVNYYVRDGATGSFVVSPGAPIDFDGATGANDPDYEPNGATRVLAVGLISAYSGADGVGSEASPLMPTSAMSQVVAQPLFIADTGDGAQSSIAIASPYEGTAKVYAWDTATSSLILKYTVPLNRNIGGTVTRNDQNFPSAAIVANETQTGSVELVGRLDAGIVIADVPVTVVVQNGTQNLALPIRSQNGTTTTGLRCDSDETLSLGITPATLKAEITEGSDGLLYKRVINSGVVSYVLA